MADLDLEYDYLFKLILVGDSYVGKTNILSKYIKNEFNQNTKSTVGVEFGTKILKIEDKIIKAQVWDTAGQERYKSITSTYYKGAKGAFIVYDITNRETFESVDKWIQDLNMNSDKNVTLLLIGNKKDLVDKRDVTKEEGEEKAKSFGLAFLETSALTGENIDKVFDYMLKEVYNKITIEKKNSGEIDYINIGNNIEINEQTEKKSTCCLESV
jgi:small GTP-binding protein